VQGQQTAQPSLTHDLPKSIQIHSYIAATSRCDSEHEKKPQSRLPQSSSERQRISAKQKKKKKGKIFTGTPVSTPSFSRLLYILPSSYHRRTLLPSESNDAQQREIGLPELFSSAII
jgi:hypothetical protein